MGRHQESGGVEEPMSSQIHIDFVVVVFSVFLLTIVTLLFLNSE